MAIPHVPNPNVMSGAIPMQRGVRAAVSAHQARQRALGVLAVIALHVGAVFVLAHTGVITLPSLESSKQKITWLVLAQPPAEVSPPLIVSKPQPRRQTRPVAPSASDPNMSAPAVQPDPKALTALRSYVWCGALDDGKQLPENAKPCDSVKWDLHTAALPSRLPTDQEKALQRQFERQLAFDKAPKLLPCGGDVICLVEGALNGFEYHMGSYGSFESMACDLHNPQSDLCARMYASRFQAPMNWQK
jgi:hypothetical protein